MLLFPKWAAAVGVVPLVIGVGTMTAGVAAADTASWCTAGATVAAAGVPSQFTAATCAVDDLTFVEGNAAVRVPARGSAVTADVLTTSGAQTLTVSRSTDGTVTVTRGSARPTGAPPTGSACSSSNYVLLGYHVGGSYNWYYNGQGAPRNVAGVAAGNLKTATANIVSGHDDCGIAGRPKTSHSYKGSSGARPGVTASAGCSKNDGRSVTGWASLSARGVLAVTCTYYSTSTHVVAASDAAINTRFKWSVTKGSCSGAYDLQGVMTHERGHTFGLGHSNDPGLTMYPSVRACDFSKRTLGKGDLLGLFAIYGKA